MSYAAGLSWQLAFYAVTSNFLHNPHHLTPNLLNLGQESVVCSHALRGGDWVWLA
jgi:hypothetical protein